MNLSVTTAPCLMNEHIHFTAHNLTEIYNTIRYCVHLTFILEVKKKKTMCSNIDFEIRISILLHRVEQTFAECCEEPFCEVIKRIQLKT